MKYLPFCLLILLNACTFSGNQEPVREFNSADFGKYWYQGKAEINTYALEQFRYGEKSAAEAVLIFVTEDFSRKKQVKLDVPEQAGEDAQKVLKLNFTKKFVTGVYPYSMMLSTFLPIYDSVPAIKIAASVQDWCGQTYSQLNYKNGAYQGKLNSFFEAEVDREIKLKARSEDELWSLIRLDPGQLPTGKVKLIPGLLDVRFTHLPLKAYEANIQLKSMAAGLVGYSAAQLQVCEVKYAHYPRQLRIYFTKAFPFEIVGWEEMRLKPDGTQEVSRARRKKVMLLDYWNKNRNAFEPLRDSLNLTGNL